MDKIDSVFAYILTKYSEHPKQSHMTPFEHFFITMKLFGLSLITSFAFFFHALCPWLLIDTGNYLTNILFNQTKSYHHNKKDLNDDDMDVNEENDGDENDDDDENENNNMEDEVDLNDHDMDEEKNDNNEEGDENNEENNGSDENEDKKEKED